MVFSNNIIYGYTLVQLYIIHQKIMKAAEEGIEPSCFPGSSKGTDATLRSDSSCRALPLRRGGLRLKSLASVFFLRREGREVRRTRRHTTNFVRPAPTLFNQSSEAFDPRSSGRLISRFQRHAAKFTRLSVPSVSSPLRRGRLDNPQRRDTLLAA